MGRICMRHAVLYQDIEVVAINDSMLKVDDMVTKFRSIPVHGNFKRDVRAGKDGKLYINNKPIHVFSKVKSEDINWGSVGADHAIESSGSFTTRAKAAAHLMGGAKKVIITAISNVPMFVCSVNIDAYKPEYTVISSASSTINCIAPIVKVVHDKFGIEEVFMSSIRAADVTDNKSVANNIIPTYTEAAEVVRMIVLSLDDKFTDLEFRIPVVNASVIDLVVKLKRTTTYHAITAAMKEAEEGPLKGVLSVSDNVLASTNLLERTESAVYYPELQFTVLDRSFKLVAYYANDWAYLKRVCDLLAYVAKKDAER
ncbi:glycerol-3-phosphate dehydrogenase [Suillus subaureus]|uniref:glyceraldehyde-3-phosphate dehydrogenase (phosphorylating) n=1 Tax=Suillus subaureus TaxID=48587 RepID=A0A9P7DU99_9AGAM|nr:glycerol-3-phosphate dehydrogenase [Suillus subaureus]KAG1803461.1 glycerol-3-phosphate dehydrogenase [Suillus subaureus]